MAQYINGAKLPVIQDLYNRWCQRKALVIDCYTEVRDLAVWYWSAKSRSKRFLNSFYPQAITLLNI
jgi:hypothetical protein